jgi:hypothetical protein
MVPTVVIIVKVAEEHTFLRSEKVGSQSSYLLTPQNRAEMQGIKIDYPPLSQLDSLQSYVIAVGCKIAKTGGVLNETRTSRS